MPDSARRPTAGEAWAAARAAQQRRDPQPAAPPDEPTECWVDDPPWACVHAPSSSWNSTSRHEIRPVPKNLIVPTGRGTARELSTPGQRRRAERRRRADEMTGRESAFVGGLTLAQRHWDMKALEPRALAQQMKREASYSDIFQVHPAVGPGGYLRESMYSHQFDPSDQKQAIEYKKYDRLVGDRRPGWRVAF